VRTRATRGGGKKGGRERGREGGREGGKGPTDAPRVDDDLIGVVAGFGHDRAESGMGANDAWEG